MSIPEHKPQPGVRYITLESMKSALNAITTTSEAQGTELGETIKNGLDEYKAFDKSIKARYLDLMFSDDIDTRDREVMSVLGNLPNRLHQLNIPSKELLAAKSAYYEQVGADSPENAKMHKHLSEIEPFANTAAVMPVWNVQTDMLNYVITYSHNLEKQFGALPPGDRDRCYTFVQFHEVLGHLLGHDFPAMDSSTLSRRRHLESALTPGERNIIQDLRINSFGIRYLGKTGRTFQNAFPGGVYGETIKLHTGHIPAVVETLHKFAHGQIEESVLPDEIDKSVAKWTGHDTVAGTGTHTLESLDLQKTVENLKKIKSLDAILKPHSAALEDTLDTKEFTYDNFLDHFESVYKKYQEGGKNFPDYQTLGEVLAHVKDQLKFKPSGKKRIGVAPGDSANGGNPFGDESFEIPDGSFEHYEVPSGKSSSQEREAGEQISKATNNVTKTQPGKGSYEHKEKLTETENAILTDAIQTELRRFGTLFSSMPVVEYKNEDIVPSEMVPMITKYREQQTAAKGHSVPIALPMGVHIPQVQDTPLNGLILSLVDESGSMSNTAVAAAKTALTKVCDAHNLGLVGISMAGSHEELSFSSYFGGASEKEKGEFMHRQKSGGTGNFHRPLFDFDELLQNESMKNKLQESLPEGFSVKDLESLWKQKKVGMVVITDGDIPTDDPGTAKLSKWNAYARGYKEATQQNEPPAVFISVTNRMSKTIKDGEHLIKVRKLNTKGLVD
jgi:hypothetical protein